MKRSFYEKIGEKLLELRKEKGFTQEYVAKLLNITQAAYNRYEKGLRQISAEDIFKLAKIYNTQLDYIFGLMD